MPASCLGCNREAPCVSVSGLTDAGWSCGWSFGVNEWVAGADKDRGPEGWWCPECFHADALAFEEWWAEKGAAMFGKYLAKRKAAQ